MARARAPSPRAAFLLLAAGATAGAVLGAS